MLSVCACVCVRVYPTGIWQLADGWLCVACVSLCCVLQLTRSRRQPDRGQCGVRAPHAKLDGSTVLGRSSCLLFAAGPVGRASYVILYNISGTAYCSLMHATHTHTTRALAHHHRGTVWVPIGTTPAHETIPSSENGLLGWAAAFLQAGEHSNEGGTGSTTACTPSECRTYTRRRDEHLPQRLQVSSAAPSTPH